MEDITRVYEGMYACEPSKPNKKCKQCPYQDEMNCDVVLYNDVLVALREAKDCRDMDKLRIENGELIQNVLKLERELGKERAYNEAIVKVIRNGRIDT